MKSGKAYLEAQGAWILLVSDSDNLQTGNESTPTKRKDSLEIWERKFLKKMYGGYKVDDFWMRITKN